MTTSVKKYGVPEFSELKTSTRTVIVYSNILFNLPKIFRDFYITYIDVPLTKKKKNVDKKKLSASYGSIISIQHGNEYRGVNLRKTKKHWCLENCRETIRKGEKDVHVNTVIEVHTKIEGTDIFHIRYFCTKCERYYTLRQLKKIRSFLNQVTIVISIGNIILNIMMFKDNFKVAGCRKNDDAIEATMILWDDYISRLHKGWKIKEQFKDEEPRFLFRPVMRNLDFKLGFYINRMALNRLMNSEKYSDRIFMSQCETTSHTNVNIKLYTKKPPDHFYYCLVIPQNGVSPYYLQMRRNIYKQKKEKENKYTTFIVFGSSETIISGRYDSAMEKDYNFIVTEIFEHRDLIEEKIKEPKIDLVSFLSEEEK